QMAQEPLEILKTAGKQVSEKESVPSRPIETTEKTQDPSVDEAKEKAQSKRMLTALENEIEEIRKKKKLEREQELRQEEAQKERAEEEEKKKPLPVTPSKPSRGALRGMKGKLKKLKTKAEIRMPPSG
ncbi:MAG: hypothetical protein P8Y06_02385, partial [Patescibacteria group bacterium]